MPGMQYGFVDGMYRVMRRPYAHRTAVPVDRTRSEIEHLLEKHGARSFVYGTTDGQALLAFEMRDRRLRFIVPMPSTNKTRSNESQVKAETRRRYRALLLVLKAKLEAVESQIVTFDEEFLAHIVVEGNSTVGDRMIPQLNQAIADGRMATLPPLLGPGAP